MEGSKVNWVSRNGKTELRVTADEKQIYEAEIVTADKIIVVKTTFLELKSMISKTSRFIRIRSIRKL